MPLQTPSCTGSARRWRAGGGKGTRKKKETGNPRTQGEGAVAEEKSPREEVEFIKCGKRGGPYRDCSEKGKGQERMRAANKTATSAEEGGSAQEQTKCQRRRKWKRRSAKRRAERETSGRAETRGGMNNTFKKKMGTSRLRGRPPESKVKKKSGIECDGPPEQKEKEGGKKGRLPRR